MAYLTVAGFVNVGLNLWLVSMGWDVAGVAIATIISQYVSAILLLIALFREQGVCKLSLKNLRICKDEFWSIFRIGLPSGILGTCFSLSNVIIQSAINGYGKVLTSANSVASNIVGLLYTAMNAVSSAALTFAGQNYGAKKNDRIKKVMICSTVLVLAIWFVMGSLPAPIPRTMSAAVCSTNPIV
jgi:Na+-driven multidrug efflux pump